MNILNHEIRLSPSTQFKALFFLKYETIYFIYYISLYNLLFCIHVATIFFFF